MTENPTTAPACLDDDEGGTLRVYPWASGRVSLVALDGDQCVEFGPVERHVLLDAIRGVGGEIPAGTGCMIVRDNGKITALPDGYPIAVAATFDRGRRLLLFPPAPTPAWHSARIVEATCRGRVGQWARTATDGLWVSLDGESREAYTPDLSDVTVLVPEEVEA